MKKKKKVREKKKSILKGLILVLFKNKDVILKINVLRYGLVFFVLWFLKAMQIFKLAENTKITEVSFRNKCFWKDLFFKTGDVILKDNNESR